MDHVLLAPSSNWYSSQCLSTNSSGSLAVYCANTGLVLLRRTSHPSSGTDTGSGGFCVIHIVHRAHQHRVNAVCLWCAEVPFPASSRELSPLSPPTLIASVSDDGLVKLWQCCCRSGGGVGDDGDSRGDGEALQLKVELVKQHDAHQKPVLSVDVSPVRPSLCVSLDAAGVFVVWDTVAHTTRRLQPLTSSTAAASGNSCSLNQLRCSPHSELLAAAAGKRGLLVTVSLAAGGRLLQRFVGHEAEITAITWCSQLGNLLSFEQDHLLCSVSRENQLRIWGSRTGRCHVTRSLLRSGRRGQVTGAGTGSDRGWACVTWSHLERIYCGLGDGSLQVCLLGSSETDSSSSADAQLQTVHRLHNRAVSSICCPTGTFLLSCSADRQLISHAVSEADSEGQQLIEWRSSSLGGFCYRMQCSPLDPGRLAVACGDHCVRVLNLASSDSDCTVIWQGIKAKVTAVSWHPSRDNCLAFGTDTGRVGVCDPCDAAKTGRFSSDSHGAAIRDLCWSPDGTLYSVSEKHVWKHTGDSLVSRQWLSVGGEGEAGCMRLCWGRVGTTPLAAAAMSDGSVLFHDSVGRCRSSSACSSRAVSAMQWRLHDGNERWRSVLAAGTVHGRVLLLRLHAERDTEQKLEVETFMTLTGHSGAVADLSWSSHAPELLVSCGADKSVRVWDVLAGSCKTVVTVHCRPARCCLWHPLVAGVVISAGEEASLLLWSIDHPDKSHLQIDASAENGASQKNAQKSGSTKKKKSKSKSQSSARPVGSQTAGNNSQTSNESTLERAKELVDGKRPRSQKCLFPLSVASENRGKAQSQQDIDTLLDKLQSTDSDHVSTEIANENTGNDHVTTETANENTGDGHVTTETANENTGDDHVLSDVTDQLTHLALFSSATDSEPVSELVSAEVAVHDSSGFLHQAAQLTAYRGDICHVLSKAASQSLLTDYLVSLSPMVSYNFWRGMCTKYARQLVDANEIIKASSYLTSCHKTEKAIDLLTCHRLYREALTLCRLRLPENDPKTHSVLTAWAEQLISEGNYELATKCLIKLGDLKRAARLLCCRSDLASLRLAARLFLLSGDTEHATSLVCQCVHESCQRGEWREGIRAAMLAPQIKQCAVLLCVLHETLMTDIAAITIDRLFGWCVRLLANSHHSYQVDCHINDETEQNVDVVDRSELKRFIDQTEFGFTVRVLEAWRDGGHFIRDQRIAPALVGVTFEAVPTNRRQLWLSVACHLYRSFEADLAQFGQSWKKGCLAALEECARIDSASLATLSCLLISSINEFSSDNARDFVLRALTIAMLKCQQSATDSDRNDGSTQQQVRTSHCAEAGTGAEKDGGAEAVKDSEAKAVIDCGIGEVKYGGADAVKDSDTCVLETGMGNDPITGSQAESSDVTDIVLKTADESKSAIQNGETVHDQDLDHYHNLPVDFSKGNTGASLLNRTNCENPAAGEALSVRSDNRESISNEQFDRPKEHDTLNMEEEHSRLARRSVWIHCARLLVKQVETCTRPFDEIPQLIQVLERCQSE